MSISRPPCLMTTMTGPGLPTCYTSPHGVQHGNISDMLDQRTNEKLWEGWQLLHIALK
jgi:hypothetical protein